MRDTIELFEMAIPKRERLEMRHPSVIGYDDGRVMSEDWRVLVSVLRWVLKDDTKEVDAWLELARETLGIHPGGL